MAARKTTKTIATEQTEQIEQKFSKTQIVTAKKYGNHVDFLNGNLVDGQEYSFSEVDALIENYYGKGQVK